MKYVLVISSPKYILTYAKKEQFYLACCLKKLHDKVFFIFDKKLLFTSKWWNCDFFLYALKLVHQYQWFDIYVAEGYTVVHNLEWWTDGQTDRWMDVHMTAHIWPLDQRVTKKMLVLFGILQLIWRNIWFWVYLMTYNKPWIWLLELATSNDSFD